MKFMTIILITQLALLAPTMAQDKSSKSAATKGTPKSTSQTQSQSMQLQQHILMHEQMATAHARVAECLKAGTPYEQCRAEFQRSCQAAGAPGQCGMMGPGMMSPGPGMTGQGRGRGAGKGQPKSGRRTTGTPMATPQQ